VFTRYGPIQCQVFHVDCLARTDQCRLQHYSGEVDCLHFWTKHTTAGDEIRWDFVFRVRCFTSKISFTTFCDEMTEHLKTANSQSASFMSRSTFVYWFFSWAAMVWAFLNYDCR
jgi:hypothetical protein